MFWFVRRALRALRAPLRRPLEPLLWLAAALSAKDAWVRAPPAPEPRASASNASARVRVSGAVVVLQRSPSRSRSPPRRSRARPSPREPDDPELQTRTAGAPVDRARASPGRGPPRGRRRVRVDGTSGPEPNHSVNRLETNRRRREMARRRAPFDHPGAGQAGRHAVAGCARVPVHGDVHGSQRAREGQGRASAEDGVPTGGARRRRRRRRLDDSRGVRACVPDAQAHRPVPRRQDHAALDRPQQKVVAPQDQAQARRASSAGAQDDDGEHLVPGETRGRRERKDLQPPWPADEEAELASPKERRVFPKRTRIRRRGAEHPEEAAGGDGEAPGAVREETRGC